MKNNTLKFETINEWMSVQIEPLYGCVMMEPSKIKDWEENYLYGIDQDDIYTDLKDDSYGLEEKPHITLLYGIHEDEVDPSVVADMIEQKMKPITVEISEIGVFEGDDFDVVKYDVPLTDEIVSYRRMLMDSFENTQTFDGYNPHVTISYVKKGNGKKYKKILDTPFKIKFTKGVYSYHKIDHEDGDECLRKVVNLEPKEQEKTDSGIIRSKVLRK